MRCYTDMRALLQASAGPEEEPAPAGEYPALQKQRAVVLLEGMLLTVRFDLDPTDQMPQEGERLYSEAQLLAYIDADRAMRAQAAPATVAGPSCSHVGSEGWRFHAEDMERQRDHYRHRAQTMDDHQRGECWYWMGDGNDHPESLANSLPVVIRADALRALITAAPTTQAAPAHPDDAAVDALAATMKAKLAKQRAKGYGGWDTPECTQQRLSDMLREHVAKGDPVDVANFCAFLAARCEGIAQAAPQPAVQQGDGGLTEQTFCDLQVASDALRAIAERKRQSVDVIEPVNDIRQASRIANAAAERIDRALLALKPNFDAALATRPAAPAAQGDAEDAARSMAAEYERWIGFFHRGDGDYNDFLRIEIGDAARSQAKEGGVTWPT